MKSEAALFVILDAICEHYLLPGGQYNGYATYNLKKLIDCSEEVLRIYVSKLVKSRLCEITFGRRHPNPHIKALPCLPVEHQLRAIASDAFSYSCVYPSGKHLETIVDSADFIGRPYDLELALGAHQFKWFCFEMTVLEEYKNDPRYYYVTNDSEGMISVLNLADVEELRPHDQALLESYGFALNELRTERVVACLVRYLHRLPPEHQQKWKFKEIDREGYSLHPRYAEIIVGSWPSCIEIHDALLLNLKIINNIVKVNQRGLFKDDYDENRPRDLHLLIRPTRREYDSYLILLNIVVVENINARFFKMQSEDIYKMHEGKRTIGMLNDWLYSLTQEESEDISSIVTALKALRNQRSKPAHTLNDDEYNKNYYSKQKQMLKAVYDAVALLREILCRVYKVEEKDNWELKSLRNARIIDY